MAEREDWALFRSVEGLCQKAGVADLYAASAGAQGAGGQRARHRSPHPLGLGRLREESRPVLHRGRRPRPRRHAGGDRLAVQHSPPDAIQQAAASPAARRARQRTAGGGGCRAGIGGLARRHHPQQAHRAAPASGRLDHGRRRHGGEAAERGTRIEIGFGPALPHEGDVPFAWVEAAAEIAHDGKTYDGKSSPFWYDPVQFHELILAYGSQPLRSLIAQLRRLHRRQGGRDRRRRRARRMPAARASTAAKPRALLAIARKHARPVSPDRLGFVGRDAYPEHSVRHRARAGALRQRRAAGRDPVRGRGVGAKDGARRATSISRCW